MSDDRTITRSSGNVFADAGRPAGCGTISGGGQIMTTLTAYIEFDEEMISGGIYVFYDVLSGETSAG